MSLSDFPQSSHCEKYEVGQVLTLNIVPNPPLSSSELTVRVRVSKLQEAWTLSCGMFVEILEGSCQDIPSPAISATTAFLKLFDRRYASQLRQDNGIIPWVEDIEDAYLDFIKSSKAEEFLQRLRTDDKFKEATEEEWDVAENEAFLAHELIGLYTAETATYARLHNYQNKLIPRLLAPVSLDIASLGADSVAGMSVELYQVKGILLEYLPGFTLSTLEKHAPQSCWQKIVDQAINIVHILGDNNILNADVRPDNFIVVPNGDDQYQVFMIDFGQCRLRGTEESDLDWGREKWRQDEEGAVGLVMKHKLGKLGFELVFNHSQRYLEYAEGEDE